jgi:outer membrane autotransporter protein
MALEPRLHVAFESEVLGNARQVTVQPVGEVQDFVIQGVDPSRNLVSASAGVTLETNRDFGIYSDVGMIYSTNTSAASVDAGVRYRF